MEEAINRKKVEISDVFKNYDYILDETLDNDNDYESINNEEPLDEELMMISNILKEPSLNNKKYLINDILNKLVINDVMNESMGHDLEDELINNTLKHSMTCKILAQPINNKGSLIKEPTINNILTHPMNNNFKKSLINETLNQSVTNNILKEPTINDKKSKINNTLIIKNL